MDYLQHFGLEDYPFGLTPNTEFYVELQGHQQALDVLLTAVEMGEGFLKVTGEVGTGKTLLCRKLLQEAPANWQIAYIPDPHVSPEQLRWAIALELGLQHSGNIDQHQLHHLLQRQLILLASQQKRVVILIDEAQALPDPTLEALRLMSNLETEQRKLLHVILLGQPELDSRLAKASFRQLRQRISFSYQLPQLQSAEVKAYVQERLGRAGGEGAQTLFSAPALWLLARKSRGIPRLVNILANKALLASFGRDQTRVGWWAVWQAARDTADVMTSPVRWFFWLCLCGVAAVIWWSLWR